MTFRLGKTSLRIHPLLPFFWGLCCVLGAARTLLPMLAALILHECGHLMAASLMDMRVEEVEITPLGGVISIENLSSVPPIKSFALAAAGPLLSLLGCFLSPTGLRFGLSEFTVQTFARASLLLLLINLLPVLPLDGGRMLRSALSRMIPDQTVTRVLTLLGSLIGAGLFTLSLFFAFQGRIVLSPLFAGMYLLYAAAIENRQAAGRYVTALIARRQKMEKGQCLPVEGIAASGASAVRSLLPRMRAGAYHIVFVLSPDGMKTIGTLDEQALCAALLENAEKPLKDCIKKADR